jgi:hypothetical protein
VGTITSTTFAFRRGAFWILAHKLAYRARTHWLLALPVALDIITYRSANWGWNFTIRHTVGLVTYSNTIGAFLGVVAGWAFDLTSWLLAFDVA